MNADGSSPHRPPTPTHTLGNKEGGRGFARKAQWAWRLVLPGGRTGLGFEAYHHGPMICLRHKS